MNKNIFLIVAAVVIIVVGVAISLHQTSSTATSKQTSTISSSTPHSVPPQPPIGNEYIVTEPHALMLVDSQGRRTGKDPATGTLYHEIPNTNYVEEAVNPGHPIGELFTSDLPSGRYTLYVLGGKTGFYGFDIALNGRLIQSFTGNIRAGSMIAYVQEYDASNLASSTFSFQGTVSSTASITSAPPHNLPPPPVPTPPSPTPIFVPPTTSSATSSSGGTSSSPTASSSVSTSSAP